jgi:hypothetical protein
VPFALGDLLPSETWVDWTDIDGAGIFARMRDLGLDTEVLDCGPSGDVRRVAWVGVDLPERGPLGAQINEHYEAYKRSDADDWMKSITVEARGQAGFDLTTSSGMAKRQSKLRGLFKRGT